MLEATSARCKVVLRYFNSKKYFKFYTFKAYNKVLFKLLTSSNIIFPCQSLGSYSSIFLRSEPAQEYKDPLSKVERNNVVLELYSGPSRLSGNQQIRVHLFAKVLSAVMFIIRSSGILYPQRILLTPGAISVHGGL